MGEKSGTLYYFDGVPVGEFPAITLDEKENDYAPFTVSFETAFSGSFKPRKRDRCGTRKRFTKLLMADGYSRNQANGWADYMRRVRKISYKDAYFEMRFMNA